MNTLKSQEILEMELLIEYDIPALEQFLSDFGIPQGLLVPEYEVDIYKITYSTVTPHGDPTFATGALAVPKTECPLPIASYQHGTVSHKTGVPSHLSEESNIGVLLGMTGIIVAMPDYLGLGDSPGLHPYIHAHSQATAVTDLLLSMKSLEDSLYRTNNQLFLFGYSQGGHATMAAHRHIQQNHSVDFTVTASAPMSGPYDVSGVQAEVIASDNPYPTPSYLPYIFLSYQYVYGNLYTDLSDVLISPYDSLVPIWFDGTYETGFINNQLPSVPKHIVKQSEIDSFENDTINHPLWVALRDNDVHDWLPEAPIRMIYCEADDQVTYQNAIVALEKFQAMGATNIDAVSVGSSFNHFQCVQPALINGLGFMRSYILSPESPEIEFQVSGTENEFSVEILPDAEPGSFEVVWDDGTEGAINENLPAGEYAFTVYFNNACPYSSSITLPFVGVQKINVREKIFEVFPNPARDLITIMFSNRMNAEVVLIYDLNGRVVQTEQTGNQITEVSIDIRNLNPGVYFIAIENNENQPQKLVIF